MKLKIPKGLFDILPYGAKEEWQLSSHWQYLEETIRKIANEYGFKEIRTPIFEQAELFTIGVGATSDIVTKEMYLFTDKGDRKLALKPEGTSSVLRAFVEKNLLSEAKVHKFFYIGPMFRYERPQAGRYRQHHQFGVEVLGVPSYEQDAEVIDLLLTLYRRLGLKNLSVQLNSVGDVESRNSYREALKSYLTPLFEKLSSDSKERLQKNPLRILDSKDLNDQALLKEAPSILDYLTDDAKEHFEGLCKTLDSIQVPYQINEKIVRGLDYYNKTVFEITSSDLKAQNSLGGGGRYDGFSASFGGPSLPGIGFGTGMERILQAMLAQNISFPVLNFPFLFLIPLDIEAKKEAFSLITNLRHKGIPSDADFNSKKIQASLQRASYLQATFSAILGENERKNKTIKLKNMSTRKEVELSLSNLLQEIEKLWITLKEPVIAES